VIAPEELVAMAEPTHELAAQVLGRDIVGECLEPLEPSRTPAATMTARSRGRIAERRWLSSARSGG
jgi:hypothetical protein